MKMKFIKNINKNYKQKINLIDDIKVFVKFNSGIDWGSIKRWYKNGLNYKKNNKSGIEYINGEKQWWFNGEF